MDADSDSSVEVELPVKVGDDAVAAAEVVAVVEVIGIVELEVEADRKASSSARIAS